MADGADKLDIYYRNGITVIREPREADLVTRNVEFSEARDLLRVETPDGFTVQFSDLSTDEKGADGLVWRSGLLPYKDRNGQFLPYRGRGCRYDHGLYWQLWLESPQYKRSWSNILEALTTGNWTVNLPDDLPEELEEQAKEQQKFVERSLFRLQGGWEQFLQEALYFLIGGFALFEEVYDADTKRLKKLAFRFPHVVKEWLMDPEERELVGVLCAKKGHADYILPAKHCLLIRFHAFGNDWEGNSPLRTVAKWIMSHQLFCKLEAIAAEKYGAPIATVESDYNENKTDPNASAKLLHVLDKFVAEDNPIIELPDGKRFTLHSPNGNMPDFEGVKRYCDEQVALLLKGEGALLGMRAVGTNALAESKSDDLTAAGAYFATWICNAINGQPGTPYTGPIRKMVDAAYGGPPGDPDDEYYPYLSYDVGKDNEDPAWFTTVLEAKREDALTWGYLDEERLRERLRMPAITEEIWKEVRLAKDQRAEAMAEALKGKPDEDDGEAEDDVDPGNEDDTPDEDEKPRNASFSDADGTVRFLPSAIEFSEPDYQSIERWLDERDETIGRLLREVAEEHRDAFVADTSGVTDAGALLAVRERYDREWPSVYRDRIANEVARSTLRGSAEALREFGVIENVRATREDAKQAFDTGSKGFRDHVLLIASDIAKHAYNVTSGYLSENAEAELVGGDEADEPEIGTTSAFTKIAGIYSSEAFRTGREEVVNTVRDLATDRGLPDEVVAERSSVLDGNTCDSCALLDGERAVVGSERYAFLTQWGKRCEGRKRCRCFMTYIMPDEDGYSEILRELGEEYSRAVNALVEDDEDPASRFRTLPGFVPAPRIPGALGFNEGYLFEVMTFAEGLR